MMSFSQTNDAMERARALIDGLRDVDLETWKALDALMGIFEAMMWEAAKIPVILSGDLKEKRPSSSSAPSAAKPKVDEEINRAYL